MNGIFINVSPAANFRLDLRQRNWPRLHNSASHLQSFISDVPVNFTPIRRLRFSESGMHELAHDVSPRQVPLGIHCQNESSLMNDG
jgi:hypothetical protein